MGIPNLEKRHFRGDSHQTSYRKYIPLQFSTIEITIKTSNKTFMSPNIRPVHDKIYGIVI